MSTQPATRRAEALRLAEELLADIELARIRPTDVVLKASRLARLLDDEPATRWLNFEIAGYPIEEGNNLGAEAWAAAVASNRVRRREDGEMRADSATMGELEANYEGARVQLAAATDRPVSLSSANPNQFVSVPGGNTLERSTIRKFMAENKAIMDKVIGAIHSYVAHRYQELRFGSAVESAFEVVRAEVDAAIGALVPEALPKISAAFENAASDNPEHWASATATCRRLLKEVADRLQPPGPDQGSIKMGEENYVNRLVAWIETNSTSGTATAVISSDLRHFGERIDAAVEAGHKGAHAEVKQLDASRFITGTYLLLGDVLRLRPRRSEPEPSSGQVEPVVEQVESFESVPEPRPSPPPVAEG
jgi:hypothetical protein